MALLYHWRKENYESDMATHGNDFDELCLVSNSNRWRDADSGEWCFAFSRRQDGIYVLVAVYQIEAIETTRSEYGKYLGICRGGTATWYDPEVGSDIEPTIRSLPISLKNPSLGRNFQGLAAVKSIDIKGECALHRFADKQPLLE